MLHTKALPKPLVAGTCFDTIFLSPSIWKEPFPARSTLEPLLPTDDDAVTPGYEEVASDVPVSTWRSSVT